MRRRRGRLPGRIITALLFVIAAVFVGMLYFTKLLPGTYLIIIGAILAILVLIVGILVRRVYYVGQFAAGTLMAVIITAVLVFGGVYIYKTTSTLDNISDVDTEVSKIGVYVKYEDTAQSISDISGYTFGILSALDRENSDNAIQQINEDFGTSVPVKEYAGLTELVEGLFNGEIGAIVMNYAYVEVISEIDGYADIGVKIREIGSKTVETVIEKKTPQTSVQYNGMASEEGSVFTVFISGIDTRGELTAKSRSDVNILATINTKTRQVLLVSTPRDYFVPLSISNGQPDKLTHAGIYGVNVCMDTLGMLYDIDVSYFFRVNFGGFVKIIDALGGITVYSDYEFDSKNELGWHFNQGENQVDGEAALVFSRERYSFQEGDRQRGKNQMAVIKGVIDKALSPELLKNYSSILSGVEGSFETNIPYDEIALLVRKQLSEGGSWNIVSYSVDGTGDTQKPYSMSQNAYVMVPDLATVDKAKELMQKVRNGETITQE